jgi:hypothetical protein
VYLIKRLDTSVVDVLTTIATHTPVLPTNYNVKRRIGSMKTDSSSNWIAFIQKGDIFEWVTPVFDAISLALSSTASLVTLTVPPGVVVQALLNVTGHSTSNANVAVYDPSLGAVAASAVNRIIYVPGAQVSTIAVVASVRVSTNTSAQVYAAGLDGAGTSCEIATQGWVDTRGKDF